MCIYIIHTHTRYIYTHTHTHGNWPLPAPESLCGLNWALRLIVTVELGGRLGRSSRSNRRSSAKSSGNSAFAEGCEKPTGMSPIVKESPCRFS